MVSPFAMHQQQIAMLAQQQTLLMAAAAAKPAGGDPKFAVGVQQPGINGSNIPVQTWPAAGYQIPSVVPMGGQGDLEKLMQVLTHVGHRLIDYLFFLFCWETDSFLFLLFD